MQRSVLEKNSSLMIFCALLGLLCVPLGKMISDASFALPLICITSFLICILAFSFTHFSINLLILCMLLSPEILLGQVPGRDVVVRIEDLMLILLSLVGLARISVDRHFRKRLKTPINLYILFYVVFFTIPTVKGMITDDLNVLKGLFYILKYLEYFVIYFFISAMTRSKKNVQQYIMTFLITFFIVNAYAISQIGSVGRVSAPFEGGHEPNTLGGYQVLILGIIFGLFIHVRSTRWRLPLAFLGIMSVYPFINTFSRSSYSAIIALVIAALFFARTKKLWIAILGMLIIMYVILFTPASVENRIKHTFKQHHTSIKVAGVTLGPSISARIVSWAGVYEEWKEKPVMGHGITGLGFIDGQYVRALGETGAIGLCSLLVLLHMITLKARKIYQKAQDPMLKGIVLGFLVGHIALAVHAISANTYIIIRIMEPYWFLAAVVMSIPKIEEASVNESRLISD